MELTRINSELIIAPFHGKSFDPVRFKSRKASGYMGIRERKEREKDRRRQQIIVAAKRIFTAKGFQKATMEDIAREAELSPGTIYLYFKNKEELYASLTLRILQYILMRVEHIEEDLDPEARLKALMETMFDVYAFDPLVVINMFHLQSSEILKNLSPEVREEIETMSRKALGEIAAIFSSGIADGVFINRHPTALADIFWAMFSGVVLWEESKRLIDPTKDFLRPTLETAFELFGRGLIRRSGDD
jgi:AcrR family transcriptional regulator